VVLERLDLVEILAGLLLEPVLTVENELHVLDGTDSLLIEGGGGGTSTREKLGAVTGIEVGVDLGSREVHVSDGSGNNGIRILGEVPYSAVRNAGLGSAENKLLDGVIVRKPNLLSLLRGGERVLARMLNLLNEVLVSLLGKTPTLLSVEVDVIGVYLESSVVSVLRELRR